jgi:exopolysaccharide biosynthesis polyprenyl glycosylphosphotransferase
MNTKRTRYLFIRLLYICIDVVCISLAFYVVCLSRQPHLPFLVTIENFFFGTNPFKVIFLLWTLTILFLNQTYGLYQTRRELLESLEVIQVIKSVCLASFVVIILVYLMKVQNFPRSVFMSSVGLIAASLSLWRILKKIFVDYIVARGYNNLNVLIVGAGKVGSILAQEINKRPGFGLRIIGFLDDFKVGQMIGNVKVAGKIEDLESIVKREFVSKIFITIHHDGQVFLKILEQAKELGLAVRVVPQGFEFMAKDLVQYNIGIVPILAYSDEKGYRQRGKRLFDIIVSGTALLLLLPVFAAIAILIKLDSQGPVFYKSRRYGRRGEMFNMFKFRSMVYNADDLLKDLKAKNEVDGPIFKMRNDPRMTKLGAFLRKYSLDELPQILNVFMGDMSLVGPRPLPVDQVEKEDFQQLKRLEVRPGITGLWQIRGRSDVSFARLVKWDVWYINNWSFGLDVYILLQTLPVVLKGRGAY